jgi:hypothetical protein
MGPGVPPWLVTPTTCVSFPLLRPPPQPRGEVRRASQRREQEEAWLLCAVRSLAYLHRLPGCLLCLLWCFRENAKFSATHTFQKPSTISTGKLHTLLCFHCPPIKQVVCLRSYWLVAMRELILGRASYLDAFSSYPIRRSLPSNAVGTTTRTQALRPARSSRTRASSPQFPCAHTG